MSFSNDIAQLCKRSNKSFWCRTGSIVIWKSEGLCRWNSYEYHQLVTCCLTLSFDFLGNAVMKREFAFVTCQRVFLHRTSLNKHRPQCLKQHTCLICDTEAGNIDALRRHMETFHGLSNVHTCQCCAFTFENKKTLNEHCKQLKSSGTVDESKMIASARQSPGALVPKSPKVKKSGSLSPPSPSSTSTCSTPSLKEVTPGDQEIVEEPMDEFQSLTSEIIGNMLVNGWYSDEQLVLPETWMKMVGEA
ncbi:hypothetical protein CAEBREN_21208 [Caenorhabditis brenneri]|uniref:C2H2-type domain-containing protein n=1 Tax=Caenorhabditis brenneri TaxID=135651 RepID=G0NX15_CAEBE|nr:hypothetical protein CAEBREN_21208 [Caenorhabditis brenneri]